MIRQVRVGLALRHNAFEVLLTGEPEQPLAICVEVVALQEPLAVIGDYSVKSELAVDQRQIPKVFAISESLVFLLIVCFGVFVPENVESAKERLGPTKQQVAEQRFSSSIEADDLAIEHASPILPNFFSFE